MLNETDVAILEWEGKKYAIERSVFNTADVLQMPDGTLLNIHKMGIETCKNSTEPHRVISVTTQLPTLKVVTPRALKVRVN